MLKNTEQYVKSGGMEISRTVSGNDGSVGGGGVMAQHRLRGPGPTHDSECFWRQHNLCFGVVISVG